MFDSREAYKQKLEICESCTHYNSTLRQCGVCKCIMTFKARLKGNTCPLNKHDVASTQINK